MFHAKLAKKKKSPQSYSLLTYSSLKSLKSQLSALSSQLSAPSSQLPASIIIPLCVKNPVMGVFVKFRLFR